VVVRNEIEAGRIPGPRLLANGPEITVTGGLGDNNHLHRPLATNSSFTLVVDGPHEMRSACRALVREGVDLLKLNLSGDDGLPYAEGQRTVMSEEEAKAAVEVAQSRGKRVCVHARGADSVRLALRLGIEIVYHANYLDEETLDQLEAARDRVFVVPAVGVVHMLCREGARFGITPEWCREAGLEKQIEASQDGVPKMRKRGVRVLPGGDYGFAWNPHGTYARELQHFVELLGVSPADTLVAATRLGGEIMGRGHELGQVKPGYLADLLLVDGDPLADIGLLQDPAHIRAVMKDGRFFKGP
jgi:imidazolonepropionase-like amidohydrolase